MKVFLYYRSAMFSFYFYTSITPSLGFIVMYDIRASNQNDKILSYACSTSIFIRSLSIIFNYDRMMHTLGLSGTSLRIYLTKSRIDSTQCYFLIYASNCLPSFLKVSTLPICWTAKMTFVFSCSSSKPFSWSIACYKSSFSPKSGCIST